MNEKFLRILREIRKNFRKNGVIVGLLFIIKNVPYWLRGQMIFAHHRSIIKNSHNIKIDGALRVDLSTPGFMHDADYSYLNINGTMEIYGDVSLGKGCRFDVMKGSICRLTNCKVSGMSNFIIRHALIIEDGSIISWGCEFLDTDLHVIEYENRRIQDHTGIFLQKKTWIGSHVLILKNITIGDGAIIGAGSVVTRSIPPHVLAAGNPVKIVRENVSWHD